MMKIAIFRSDLLPISEVFIRDQARALRNWQPVMVGYRLVPNGLSLDGLEVQILDGVRSGRLGRFIESLRYWRNAPDPGHVRALKRMKVDLVHAHFGTDAVDIWPVVKAAGLPMLVTLHGYDINIHPEWWEAGNAGLRRRVYPRRLLAMARHPRVSFIAVSEVIRRRAIEYGIPANKLTVSHIGVDIDRFSSRGSPIIQRSKQVLFVGRLVEKKGCEYLIRALAKLKESIPDAKLVIVGDGPLRMALEALTKDLNVQVRFLGIQPHEQVKLQMEEARIFCLPSIHAENGNAEGLPISILEAGAMGLPVVTSAVGGATEATLHGKTGFTFPEKDVPQLADCVGRLLADDRLLLDMSRKAVDFVQEKFDLRRCTAILESLYDSSAARYSDE